RISREDRATDVDEWSQLAHEIDGGDPNRVVGRSRHAARSVEHEVEVRSIDDDLVHDVAAQSGGVWRRWARRRRDLAAAGAPGSDAVTVKPRRPRVVVRARAGERGDERHGGNAARARAAGGVHDLSIYQI